MSRLKSTGFPAFTDCDNPVFAGNSSRQINERIDTGRTIMGQDIYRKEIDFYRELVSLILCVAELFVTPETQFLGISSQTNRKWANVGNPHDRPEIQPTERLAQLIHPKRAMRFVQPDYLYGMFLKLFIFTSRRKRLTVMTFMIGLRRVFGKIDTN